MSSLVDIQLQIDKLQKQAELIKTREFSKTVQDIRQKMQAFGITTKHLQTAGSSKPGSPAPKTKPGQKTNKPLNKRQGKPVAAKYRGPAGEGWSGRGLMPRWLRTLVEQGQKKEEFLIV